MSGGVHLRSFLVPRVPLTRSPTVMPVLPGQPRASLVIISPCQRGGMRGRVISRLFQRDGARPVRGGGGDGD